MTDDPFLPIAQHGLIGGLRSCALIGTDGTIDWFCAPRFDSPSVFGSILDPDEGGSWRMQPLDEEVRTSQFYFPDSNVLVTRFMTERGVAEVHDFMPVLKADDKDHRQRIVRRVSAVRGATDLRMELKARPDYGRVHPETTQVDHGVLITGGDLRLGLTATCDLDLSDGSITAKISIEEGQEALFALEVLGEDEELVSGEDGETARLFSQTAA